MRCGIATWTLMEPAVPLTRRVEQLAEMGF